MRTLLFLPNGTSTPSFCTQFTDNLVSEVNLSGHHTQFNKSRGTCFTTRCSSLVPPTQISLLPKFVPQVLIQAQVKGKIQESAQENRQSIHQATPHLHSTEDTLTRILDPSGCLTLTPTQTAWIHKQIMGIRTGADPGTEPGVNQGEVCRGRPRHPDLNPNLGSSWIPDPDTLDQPLSHLAVPIRVRRRAPLHVCLRFLSSPL